MIEEKTSTKCSQVIKFGPSKSHRSNLMVDIPLIVKRIDDRNKLIKVKLMLWMQIVPSCVPSELLSCGNQTWI